MVIDKYVKRARIKKALKDKIRGTKEKPRLTVYKSCRNIYAQIIDDVDRVTLCSASTLDKSLSLTGFGKSNKEIAGKVGKILAQRAKDKKISKIVFDRNGYKFHGRIKALADACREEGLIF